MEPNVEKKSALSWPYMSISSLGTSFFTKFIAVGIAWGWGYMNWSIAWLIAPVILTVLKSERQKDRELKRLMAQAAVMSKEKELITSRIDELPSWVYFPDYDRAEWLNKILYKVWPNVNHFAKGLLKETIEPSIVECLAEYKMKGFAFERMVLGRIPPKIYGIKAYDINTSRNEIILDADILYAGDCDITFTVGTLKAGIRDFQLRGIMRIVMKPLIHVMPLVGGVQVFFLNNPNIDFNLIGAADVLDLPGFSDALRKIIAQQVSAIVVLPNKISISLSEHVPAEVLKTPEPEGILRVHVIEAKHLMKKDIGVLGKGKSDPYAVISVGAQEYRTKTIDNTVNPQWDFWCEFDIQSAMAQQLNIHLWDYDDTKGDESLGRNNFMMDASNGPHSKLVANLFDKDNTGLDDPLGRATIEVSKVKKKGTVDTWISLEFAKHGMVHLRLTWLQLSKNIDDLSAAIKETQQLRVTSMSTAILILYIDSAKNLPHVRGNKQPDVYLEANIGNKMQRTRTILRSCDPVWEQGFTFLVGNPETDTLHVKIVDEKSGSSVGSMTYNISALMEKNDLEIQQQPFHLDKSGNDSKVIVSMVLRMLKYEEPETANEEDEDDDHDINELNRRIERQESELSNSSGVISSDRLKKQSSKDSMHSATNSLASAAGMTSVTGTEVTPPVVEEAVVAAPNHNLIYRTPSVTSYAGEAKLGRIQLTLRYSVQRQKLTVTVHKIANLPLPLNDPSNVPDPYVKLYLLPDRHKDTKRKTAVIKDNCNPVFDEQFEYTLSQGDLNTCELEVSVCTQKAWLSTGSNIMGQLVLKLSDVEQELSNTRWHDLLPEIKD